jgi:hypothetical protein
MSFTPITMSPTLTTPPTTPADASTATTNNGPQAQCSSGCVTNGSTPAPGGTQSLKAQLSQIFKLFQKAPLEALGQLTALVQQSGGPQRFVERVAQEISPDAVRTLLDLSHASPLLKTSLAAAAALIGIVDAKPVSPGTSPRAQP